MERDTKPYLAICVCEEAINEGDFEPNKVYIVYKHYGTIGDHNGYYIKHYDHWWYSYRFLILPDTKATRLLYASK